MKVEQKAVQEAIVYLGEEISISNSDELKTVLQDLYDKSFKTIAVDFSITTMIDSSCLGKLLMFQKKLKESNRKLIIINVTSKHIRKMFDLIQLHKVISIVD